MLDEILNFVPKNIKDIIMKISNVDAKKIEEVRLREGKPLAISVNNRICYIDGWGNITSESDAYVVSRKDIENIIQLISNYSIYAFEEELKNGFITIKGGHRVGLTGRVVLDGERIKTQKHISCINFRITKELKGISNELLQYILNNQHINNTLIISPPRCGKTTLLRDIARNLSSYGFTVGIVDERSEIAGCYNGVPQRDVGPNTDVLDACPKHTGILLMIRSMSPSVIITDEIGDVDDVKAIRQCLKAGVSIVTSIHGYDLEDIFKRISIKDLFEDKFFDRYIILSSKLGTGTLEEVLDSEGNVIYEGPQKLEVKI